MKKWIYAGLTAISLSFFGSAWATETADFTAAQNVIENWFAAMKNDPDKAASFLAPQFTSVHTDGIVRDKTQEIELIKKLHMKNYHLTDFKFSITHDDIIVTYKDQGAERIDNKPIADAAATRLAVLQKQRKKWLIIAYANLDKIN
jgi:hypothetical protein